MPQNLESANGDGNGSTPKVFELLPSPIFLGVAQRVNLRENQLDLIGLGDLAPFNIYPQQIDRLSMIFAVPAVLMSPLKSFKILVSNESKGGASGTLTIAPKPPEETIIEPVTSDSFSQLSSPLPRLQRQSSDGSEPYSSDYSVMRLPCPPMLVDKPCVIRLDFQLAEEQRFLGRFMCTFVQLPPILEDERRALLSRPGAIKSFGLKVSCNKCNDELKLQASITPELDARSTLDGWIPIAYSDNNWKCKCGNAAIDLEFAKKSMPTFFRLSEKSDVRGPFQLTRLYEKRSIDDIIKNYETLIDSNPSEEAVQSFLTDNSVIWSFLSPTKIQLKPSILSKNKADFAILTAAKLLYIIEIEKPQTRLTTRKGGISAELQAGADQIRGWRVTFSAHRLAILSDLGYSHNEVHDVRFLLIAGRTSKTKDSDLINLRQNGLGDFEFKCFDELTGFLHRLRSELDCL